MKYVEKDDIDLDKNDLENQNIPDGVYHSRTIDDMIQVCNNYSFFKK